MVANKILYANCLGVFAFDKQYKLIAKEDFSSDQAIKFLEKKQIPETQFVKNFKNAERIDFSRIPPLEILEFFNKPEFFEKFREINILFARKQIRESFSNDQLIMQTVNAIEDIDKIINNLSKRLKDWYKIVSPEIVYELENNERIVYSVSEKSKKELLTDLKLNKHELMGAQISKNDEKQTTQLAKEIKQLYELKKNYATYLEKLMTENCPNIFEITGTMIGAKLISIAGGLFKLSQFPASTVQLLGAEKALFRHMKTGAKPPKFGVLLLHPIIASAKKQNRGKIARVLADKISIAAKVDYFKGDFVGDKLKKQAEQKITQWN